MQERELYAYHLVTKGEDFLYILESHISNDGLKLNKENADVAMKYVGQTIRAIREVSLKW